MKRVAARALLGIVAFAVAVGAAAAPAAAKDRPRAALVVASPPGPLPEELAAARVKLQGRYSLLSEPTLRRVLEGFVTAPSVEARVQEALDRARQRMRQLDLGQVAQALVDAERAAADLAPTPAGRSLVALVFVREAALALINKDQASARRTMALALSADPSLTLEPMDASPPMTQLLASERARRSAARTGILDVRTGDGPAQVVVEGVSRGVTPAQVTELHQGHLVVWCVRDGFRPKVVQVELRAEARVDVSLEALDPVSRAAPLVEAMRRSQAVSRNDAARALAAAIDVDVIELMGSDARTPTGLVEMMRVSDVVIGTDGRVVAIVPKRPWYKKGWVWGVIAVSVAAVATGTALGVVYGTRQASSGSIPVECCR